MSEPAQGAAAQRATTSPDETSQDARSIVRGLAHDLRQPLSTIESLTYYLGIVLPREESKVRQQVAKLQEQIREMNWILADAVHYCQASPPHRELLELDGVISGSVPEWVHTEGLAVRLDLGRDLPPVRLDLEQVQHLLHNLLSFFCRAGGPATVSTSATAEEVCLRVSGTVSGDEAAELESLLEPFRQRHSRGSSLALASAGRIVEAHAGRIELQPGSGGSFSVTVAFPLGG